MLPGVFSTCDGCGMVRLAHHGIPASDPVCEGRSIWDPTPLSFSVSVRDVSSNGPRALFRGIYCTLFKKRIFSPQRISRKEAPRRRPHACGNSERTKGAHPRNSVPKAHAAAHFHTGTGAAPHLLPHKGWVKGVCAACPAHSRHPSRPRPRAGYRARRANCNCLWRGGRARCALRARDKGISPL